MELEAKEVREKLNLTTNRYDYLIGRVGMEFSGRVHGTGRAHRFSYGNLVELKLMDLLSREGFSPNVVRKITDQLLKYDKEVGAGIFSEGESDVKVYILLGLDRQIIVDGKERRVYRFPLSQNALDGFYDVQDQEKRREGQFIERGIFELVGGADKLENVLANTEKVLQINIWAMKRNLSSQVRRKL